MTIMRYMFSKVAFLAAVLSLSAVPFATQAAGPAYQGIGLPGPLAQTQIQLDEMRVTYRFDQMGQRGKAQDAVPVQTTYKFHNPGPTQTLDVGVPLPQANGKQAELTAVFVNGQETKPTGAQTVGLKGVDQPVRAAVFSVTVFQNSDLILDVRINQPVEKLEFPFDMHTGAGWDGTIQNGSIEALLPYDAANWNVDLRKRGDGAMLPLAYSGRSALWTFADLKTETSNDVYWTLADPSAMDYYMRGNARYQQTQGDAESYAMMRNALLDMVPCGQTRLPLSTWWNSTYDTVTTGLLAAQYPNDIERAARALDLWSDHWNVPHGDNLECQSMRQRPDRYRTALNFLFSQPKEQLSTVATEALANHYGFLRALVKAQVPDTKLAGGQTDPLNDANLTDREKQVMAQWDDRFAPNSAAAAAQKNASATSSTVAAYWNKVKTAFPNLSLKTQIAIFTLLALCVLIGVALIVFGWKEKPANDKDRLNNEVKFNGPSVFKPGPPAKPLYDRPNSISGAAFPKPETKQRLDEAYQEPQSGLGSGIKTMPAKIETKPQTPPTPTVNAKNPTTSSVSTAEAKPLADKPTAPAANAQPTTVKFAASTPDAKPPTTKPTAPIPPRTIPPLADNAAPANNRSTASQMPWEQPPKMEPLIKQNGQQPPTVKPYVPVPPTVKNNPTNTQADQSEHKNGPTIRI